MPIGSIHPLMFIAGQSASLEVRRIENVSSLADVEFRVTSQFGEDGIIEWLIHWLDIDTKKFIEIGASDYNEANTRFLLENNWRGLLIDANPKIRDLQASPLWWRHHISAVESFVNAENVNQLIASDNFHGEVGLLSLDIDGMDFWIWRAITVVAPIVVVCEYNSVFGDMLPIVVPYDPTFDRTRAHASNIYWGASIGALDKLAVEKGYRLVGTNSTGHNAFFIRQDYLTRLDGRIANRSPRVSLLRTPRSGFAGGLKRLEVISGMPVIDLRDGRKR
jgi:hypothetical protein